jgi:plasmid maintenance system antidote protein VapI
MAKPKPPRPQNLLDIVKARMEERDLTAYKLAQLSGLSRATVGNYVYLRKQLTSNKLLKLLAALDLLVVPAELVKGKD